MNLIQTVREARKRSTPLIVIRTADPTSTTKGILDAYKSQPPAIQWDIARGAMSVNAEGATALAEMLAASNMEPSSTTNPTEFLEAARKNAPEKTVIFMHNVHRITDDAGAVQALWNLRDSFKTNFRTLIGLCPNIQLPAELSQDMLVLDEPLPTDADLKTIIEGIYQSIDKPIPDEASIERMIDATLGLAAFPAEQSLAMCLNADGTMRMDDLWERKRGLIEQTPGLSVWRGGDKFADVGGCTNVKTFLSDVLSGEKAPRGIVFLDEIEKSIGTGGDTSGVSQGMLGTLLTWMQDNEASGLIFIGPPGAAKSALAKAAGNEGRIPTIAVDMGAMKNSLVGESEARFRNALKVVDAVTQKRALFIATCNSIGILPPELRRRFTFGTFFFDLPTDEERAAIWPIYLRKYSLDESQPRPNDAGWTGAEIKQCATLAWRLRRTLVKAALTIVPVAKSAAQQIAVLRDQAAGKFISASYEGTYEHTPSPQPQAVPAGRAINFSEVN